MLNKYKKVLVLICIGLNISFFSFSQKNFQNSFTNSWYKKALDACMHVWGDVRTLRAMQKDMNEKQRIICFDALIGRLTQADKYVEHMINGKGIVSEDDIAYFIHILGLLNHACITLSMDEDSISIGEYKINKDEQIQCLLSVLQTIKRRLEAVLGPEFILSKIDQIE